jgi:hypothetical protein
LAVNYTGLEIRFDEPDCEDMFRQQHRHLSPRFMAALSPVLQPLSQTHPWLASRGLHRQRIAVGSHSRPPQARATIRTDFEPKRFVQALRHESSRSPRTTTNAIIGARLSAE